MEMELMGRKPDHKQQQAFLDYLRSGRDEMNLLEHSVSSASKNVDFKTRSVEFSKEANDPETGESLQRIWKVTFSGEYGRPVPKDDDVFVALMKVSQAAGLMDKCASGQEAISQVPFTSYQLIQILGWGDDGRSYKAIDDALNRLCGVRIIATNYFYDNATKLWVDRKFGIIDDVYLYERAKYDRAKQRAVEAGEPNPQSWLRWSDVMLDSFQAGFVRQLDLEIYRSLKNPIARKLFRYLGKQFWADSKGQAKRQKHEIDIRELCHEKLGYPKYDNNTCKRKLQRPLAELEEAGVFGLRHDYDKSYGRCTVVFRQAKRAVKATESSRSPLVVKLVEIGVSRDAAEGFVQRHTPERIREDVEDSAFRESRGMLKKGRAGTLYSMLSSDDPWGRPEGFVSSVEREQRKQKSLEIRTKKAKVEQQRQAVEQKMATEKKLAFAEFFANLGSDETRQEFVDQALCGNKFIREAYQQHLRKNDLKQAEQYRQIAMQQLWEKQSKASTA